MTLTGLRQPNPLSCGPAALVAGRMLLDPAYAVLIEQGTTRQGRFTAEVLGMHRRVTGLATASGRAQLPWPRGLGTPPWAVAAQLSATGSAEHPPQRYRTHITRLQAADAFDCAQASLEPGTVCAIYVGNAWLPRHVVLATGVTAEAIDIYEPGRGRMLTRTREDFAQHRLRLGRWDVAWAVVSATPP